MIVLIIHNPFDWSELTKKIKPNIRRHKLDTLIRRFEQNHQNRFSVLMICFAKSSSDDPLRRSTTITKIIKNTLIFPFSHLLPWQPSITSVPYVAANLVKLVDLPCLNVRTQDAKKWCMTCATPILSSSTTCSKILLMRPVETSMSAQRAAILQLKKLYLDQVGFYCSMHDGVRDVPI